MGAGAFLGTFTYGKRYLARTNVVELDPYHLKLTDKPMQFTTSAATTPSDRFR